MQVKGLYEQSSGCVKRMVDTTTAMPQQTGRRAGLEARIKALEGEKIRLQRDIGGIKEMLTTAALEKKARVLEGEVAHLKSVKGRLVNQLPNNPRPNSNPSTPKTSQARRVQKQADNQQQPVRYGTWSKLPLS